MVTTSAMQFPATAMERDRSVRSRRCTVSIRSASEIEQIRRAGAVVRSALEAAAAAAKVGASTADLDQAAGRVLIDSSARSLLLDHPHSEHGQPFPACTCVSVNEEVLHGVPGPRRLAAGDVVSIDCAASLNGWCADAAVTVKIGGISPAAQHLCDAAEMILASAIESMRPGRAWSTVAAAMQDCAAMLGVCLVGGYAGHGIGRHLHEAPSAPCVVDRSFEMWSDFTLRPGMVLAVEPILSHHQVETSLRPDGWTVSAPKGSLFVHVEHTVAITRRGAEVLTDGREPTAS